MVYRVASRGEMELTVKIIREEMARKLEEHGLPAVVFGTDKPVLELEAVKGNGGMSDGEGNGGSEGNGAAGASDSDDRGSGGNGKGGT
jgi:hypothetical protein